VGLTDERGAHGFGSSVYEDEQAGPGTAAAIGASLGCRVPTAGAELHEGETVLDLGSGADAASSRLGRRRYMLAGTRAVAAVPGGLPCHAQGVAAAQALRMLVA
jgi:hypothetical protein